MRNQISKFDIGSNPKADFRTKDICNVCGRVMPDDAGVSVDGSAMVQNYCKFCGMEAEAGAKFCCGSCEGKFKKSMRTRKRKSNS